MTKKEIDSLNELFRSKLQDLEADTRPEDWDAIVSRLPEGKKATLRLRWWYGAAAVFLALFIGGGGFYLSRRQTTDTAISIASVPAKQDSPSRDATPSAQDSRAFPAEAGKRQAVLAKEIATEEATPNTVAKKTPAPENQLTAKAGLLQITRQPAQLPALIIADAAPGKGERKPASARKWGFGMGVGGLTEGSSNSVNTYLLRSSYQEDDRLLALNAVPNQNMGKLPRTNIKHKTPLSFGFAVSRYLNNRLALQTGLTYSFLRSEWETQATYKIETKQNLHFIGIPLALTYKIAEWKPGKKWRPFMVYASAGGMAEINVAGEERYSGNAQTGISHENVRMKELQWSVSARAGISYPLFRPLHIFGEVGASYYFDNGSEMETLYSDKPFNLSPQLGFRLSF
jgi:hypothetical protein